MPRLFVVIPAAGHSRRMGSPKLLLDLGGRPVIVRLLEAVLASSRVASATIVVRRDATELRNVLERLDDDRVRLVVPETDPPEMRQSVELALADIRDTQHPAGADSWALIPADHPLISGETFDRLEELWRHSDAEILVPTVDGAGGHPTFFRWSLAADVPLLPADQGLNVLIESDPQRVERIEVDAEEILLDLDSPEDYERAKMWWTSRREQ